MWASHLTHTIITLRHTCLHVGVCETLSLAACQARASVLRRLLCAKSGPMLRPLDQLQSCPQVCELRGIIKGVFLGLAKLHLDSHRAIGTPGLRSQQEPAYIVIHTESEFDDQRTKWETTTKREGSGPYSRAICWIKSSMSPSSVLVQMRVTGPERPARIKIFDALWWLLPHHDRDCSGRCLERQNARQGAERCALNPVEHVLVLFSNKQWQNA